MYSVRRARSTSSAEGSQSFSGAAALTPARRRLSRACARSSSCGSCEQTSCTSSPWRAASSRSRSWLARRWRRSALLRFWKKRRPGGQLGGSGDLAVVEVGVAAVQQPAVAGLDRDAGVAARVADQRDQQHLGAEVGKDPHALEAEPLVALDLVPDPARVVLPVDAEVAGAVAQARVEGGVELAAEDVDLGLGEVGQAAGVVGVEVGGDDLAHVGGVEAEALTCSSAVSSIVGLRVHQREDGPELFRVARVLGAEAGVDQDQPVVGLDQQAVADAPARLEQAALAVDQPRPAGAERAAVEVVDAHAAGAVYSDADRRVLRLSWLTVYRLRRAGVAELVYAIDSKSIALTGLWVRVPPPVSNCDAGAG